MDEIATILGEDKATTATPGWFSARTPAIKNILAGMTGEELIALDAEVEAISKQGYSEKVKRR
jgi:hypothetical protein